MKKQVSQNYDKQSVNIATIGNVGIHCVRIEDEEGKKRIRLQGLDAMTGELTQFIEFYMDEMQTKIFKLKQYVNLLPTDIRIIFERIRDSFDDMPLIKEYAHWGFQHSGNKITGYQYIFKW